MTLRLQIILTTIFALSFLLILNMIRKRKLELKYALVWFIVIIGLIFLLWIPDGLAILSNLLGIYSPVNMIFLFGFLLALIIIFVLTVTVSRMSIRIRKLAQIVAIQNYDMKDKNERVNIDELNEKLDRGMLDE